MKPAKDKQEVLFQEALRRAKGPEREGFLDGACMGNPPLRALLEALLEAHESADPFVQPPVPPPGEATVIVPSEERPGTLIGRYKLLEKIGEGGFGVVYVAEQREPVKRRVALKIIKLGMDTRQVVARFEAERQALALMDHPNIAKVLDAGATETGRPFFVMELVKGIPITHYCDEQKLGTRERLDLFIQVCHAIQHAHQKGIIHRDIKPSNILVTLHDGVPVPKVIDFGIAKATQQELTEKTVYTQFHQFIGTPAYISPEQAEMSGLDIDTRSDIYSLGVLLYELLTGNTPFDTKELLASGLDEMRKIIREREPVRPSTRLRQTASGALPSSSLSTLHSALSTDLDWIVMKCLEKDRTRRYETANGVAYDIERHLKHEPVVARPPSTAYRVAKFVRRNQLMVAAGSAVVAALVIGLGLSTWLFFREQHARRRAVDAEQKQRQSRQEAEANAKKAQAEREQAEANAYAADMNLAQQALVVDDLGQALRLLAHYRPGSGREHLRGFEWRCLAADARSDYAAIDTSSAIPVRRLALSPDGRTLAVGRLFASTELWDPASLNRIATLETNFCGAVAFAPTGRLLAVSAPRGGIRLWQLEPPRVVGELAHTNYASRLSFSPDGRHLASSHLESGVCVWDLETRQTVRRYLDFQLHRDPSLGPICFSPDGGQLAVGDDSGRIRILDWAANRLLVDIPAHHQQLTSLAYSPDGKLLASGSGYSPEDIRLWNPATGQPAGSLAGHRSWICALQFSSDGSRLLSASTDQTIGIWDVAARRRILKLRGHLDEVYSLAFDERRTNLITGCRDGTLARWDIDKVRPHALRLDLPGQPRFPGYAAPGPSVAVLDQQGAVALWRPGDPQQLSVIAALGTNNAALATAPGRGLLACATHDGPVRIWSLQSANLVTNLGGHAGAVERLRFSNKEDFLLAGNASGLVTIWDAKTWAKRASVTETNALGSAALSPDGRLLVLGLLDARLEWWDAVRGQRLAETACHRLWAPGLDFSPDGSTLASGSQDGTVALWDTRTRRRTAYWKGHFLGVHAVAFSPDGARLATGLNGGYVARVWDLRTQRELLTLAAPGDLFYWVKFSSDGDALLCGDEVGHCYLWRPPPFVELDLAAKGTPNSD
jgi:WD40 repeat protein/tRNA A-37 threonylcarbamoyl transferase component Bud32